MTQPIKALKAIAALLADPELPGRSNLCKCDEPYYRPTDGNRVTPREQGVKCNTCLILQMCVETVEQHKDESTVPIEVYSTSIYGNKLEFISSPTLRQIVQGMTMRKSINRHDKENITALFNACGLTVNWIKVVAPEDQ